MENVNLERNSIMSLMFTNYPLDYVKLCLSEERWAELEPLINQWEKAKNHEGNIYKNMWVNPPTMKTFYCDKDDIRDNYNFEYNQKLVLQEFLTEEEIELINKDAINRYRNNEDVKDFENGIKFKESEWGDPVFNRSGDFFYSVDEYRELYREEEYEWDDWLYGSFERHTLDYHDLGHIMESLSENVDLEDFEGWKAPQYLIDAWQKFVDEENRKYWVKDSKKIIILD